MSEPRNDYSGLNSLRARLKNRDWDGKSPLIDRNAVKSGKRRARDKTDTDSSDISGKAENGAGISGGGQNYDRSRASSEQSDGHGRDANTETSFTDYLTLIESGEECVGAPIYFFFALGTNRLTDASQLVNINELTRVAKSMGWP